MSFPFLKFANLIIFVQGKLFFFFFNLTFYINMSVHLNSPLHEQRTALKQGEQ